MRITLAPTADNATTINTAIDLAAISGGEVILSAGGWILLDQIVLKARVTLRGEGIGTNIVYRGVHTGSKAAIVVPSDAFNAELRDFQLNHEAFNYSGREADYGGNIIMGSAIVVMADEARVSNLQVLNGWDNGLAVVRVETDGTIITGAPRNVRIQHVHSEHCGQGDHGSGKGKIGAGVNIASGTDCTVSDCTDLGSYLGYIIELGAGARTAMVNCLARETRHDATGTGGSGHGFYVGGTDSQLTNCNSVNSNLRGFWHDGPAQNVTYSGCFVKGAQREGWRIKGSRATFHGCRSKDNSQESTGAYDAFLIDSSANQIDDLEFMGCVSDGDRHRHGMNFEGTNSIKARIIGGTFDATQQGIKKNGNTINVWP